MKFRSWQGATNAQSSFERDVVVPTVIEAISLCFDRRSLDYSKTEPTASEIGVFGLVDLSLEKMLNPPGTKDDGKWRPHAELEQEYPLLPRINWPTNAEFTITLGAERIDLYIKVKFHLYQNLTQKMRPQITSDPGIIM